MSRQLPGAARWARLGVAAYLVVVVALTLAPVVEPWVLSHLDDLLGRLVDRPPWDANRLVEPLSNVALFAPLAFLLCLAAPGLRRHQVWLVCFIGSVCVEITQALLLPGRTPSLVDVCTNSTGAGIGVLLHWLLTRRAPVRTARA